MPDSTEANTSHASTATLQLAYFRALELAQFRGGFLARTAHELRSPLNKIISLQQMILEGLCDSPEEEREFTTEALAAALKLLEYLDFMIRVSKIQMGRVVPEFQRVDLSTVLDQVNAMTHLQATDRNLRLDVAPVDDAIQVWTDPAWLQNVLTTLIEMAIDGGDRGTIRLSVDPHGPENTCCLLLDDDRPSTHWQEPTELPPLEDFELDDKLSSSLRMTMVDAMLTALEGRLSILEPSDDKHPLNRLQLCLPQNQQN